MLSAYENFRLQLEGRVLTVFISNPPMNLLDWSMVRDLDLLGLALEKEEEVSVVVFDSESPEFFIAHADLEMFMPGSPPPPDRPTQAVNDIFGRFTDLPQVTMGVVEGRAIGGGAEFLLSLDMSFAALETARLGFFEVALGTIPGAGGTQRLPRQCGRARALEIILSCEEYDAGTAANYGWINRALPAEELRDYSYSLARRMALFPLAAIKAAKKAVGAAELPIAEGLARESQVQAACHAELAAEPSRLARFLAVGGQRPEVELARFSALLAEIQHP